MPGEIPGRSVVQPRPVELVAPARWRLPWVASAALAWVAAALGVLLVVAAVPLFAPLQPEHRLSHRGAEFSVRAGIGATLDEQRQLSITATGEQRIAIQSLPLDVPVAAGEFPLLRYRWRGFPRSLELSFVFRTAGDPEDVQTVALPPAGRHPAYFDLSRLPAWRGRITEIGFAESPAAQLVPEDVAFRPFSLVEVQLWSPSWRGSLAALGTDWFAFRPWALMSVSALGPDAPWPHKPAPALALLASILTAAAVLALAIRRRARLVAGTVAVAFAVGWVLLDVRWLVDFGERAALTRELHAGRPAAARREVVPDRELLAAAARVQGLLAGEAPHARIVVATDAPYAMLRLSWHLLPLNAVPWQATAAAALASTRAPVWVVTHAASGWRFDAARRTLHGPAFAHRARLVLAEGELRVYRLDGAVP
ncbi:MAG: hypothetical protein J0H15_10720 [Xanthomonadales bacterium]|nr:hypothetical protein [Xanthomonadales bacterium]